MSEIQTGSYNAFPFRSFIPFYVNGLGLSNDVTTPNSLLDIGVGSIVDYTGTYQMVNSSALVVSNLFTGIGGLDTGTVAASTVYNVYLVSDPVTNNPIGGMISLALPAVGPLMPYGYGAYALIGHVTTDASSHFLKGYWSDSDSAYRVFTYDAPIIALSGGTSTSYAGVALTAFVPAYANVPVSIYSNFTANAAADVENLQGYNSTGDAVTIVAPVAGATAHTTSQNTVLAQLNTAAPSIKYKVSAGSVSLYVVSYSFNL